MAIAREVLSRAAISARIIVTSPHLSVMRLNLASPAIIPRGKCVAQYRRISNVV